MHFVTNNSFYECVQFRGICNLFVMKALFNSHSLSTTVRFRKYYNLIYYVPTSSHNKDKDHRNIYTYINVDQIHKGLKNTYIFSLYMYFIWTRLLFRFTGIIFVWTLRHQPRAPAFCSLNNWKLIEMCLKQIHTVFFHCQQ